MALISRVRRYTIRGMSEEMLLRQLQDGGVGVALSVTSLTPLQLSDVTIECDANVYDARAAEIDQAAAEAGFALAGEDLPAVLAATLLRRTTKILVTDVTITDAQGWVPFLVCDDPPIITRGGSFIGIACTMSGEVTTGARARLKIAGGAYGAGTVVRGARWPVGGSCPISWPAALPSTPGIDTAYIVSVEVMAVTGGAITVGGASNKDEDGAVLSVFEYA